MQHAAGYAQGMPATEQSATTSMMVTQQLSDMASLLERIESDVSRICGGGYADPKQAGPAAVPNGLHAQWAERMGSHLSQAERIANILSNA